MKRIIVYLGLSCMLVACNKSSSDMPAAAYKTFVINSSDCVLNSSYSASLAGKQFVEIRPQISGTITDICINEGSTVRKGQILFIIDQVPYKAALETAVANVKTAQAKLETAKLTLDSKQELFKQNVVSEFDLKTAQNAYSEAEAALALAKAQETNARNDLSYTEVKSPVDGMASMIPYRVGALVNSSISEPLVTVSDDSSVYAYFSLTENQVLDIMERYGSLQNAIENMSEVELKMSNGKIYKHKGRIDAISGTIEQGTGTVSVRAVFPNEEGILRNGGSGNVILPTVLNDCITIPQAATYEIQNKTFVYKVVNGYTKSTSVDVFRLNNGTEYVVNSGVQVGDTIIAEGAGLLRDGIRIE